MDIPATTIWLPFKNMNAGTVPAHGFVQILDGTTLDGNDEIATGDQVSTTYNPMIGVNDRGDVPTGQYGRCAIYGAVRFLFDTGSPTRGNVFGPKHGQWTGVLNYPGGATVIQVVDATNHIAWGILNPTVICIGKSTGAITAGSSTTSYNIYSGAAGSEADAGYSTVPSAYADVAIATAKKIAITLVNGLWYMSQREC